MKKLAVAAALALASVSSSNAQVISQIYGGGGNAGAPFTNDFIELFNNTASPISLAGWSVQYASATGTTWLVTNLSGTIQPSSYYLVQEAAGGTPSAPLPTPDATGSIAMAAGAGKVALVNNTTALTGANPLPNLNILDFAGYGATANAFEGTGPTPAPSNTTSVGRSPTPGTDSGNNNVDFVVFTPPVPHNSTPVPEPGTLALVGLAAAGFGARRIRRTKAKV